MILIWLKKSRVSKLPIFYFLCVKRSCLLPRKFVNLDVFIPSFTGHSLTRGVVISISSSLRPTLGTTLPESPVWLSLLTLSTWDPKVLKTKLLRFQFKDMYIRSYTITSFDLKESTYERVAFIKIYLWSKNLFWLYRVVWHFILYSLILFVFIHFECFICYLIQNVNRQRWILIRWLE